MKTITCTFKSEGKTIKKTAILSDSLDRLSESKRNEATDILIGCREDGYWSIIFEEEEDDAKMYEIEFKYDEEKTLTPIKALTWEYSYLADAQFVNVKIK